MKINFPELTCRKCEKRNPMVYFAPVSIAGKGTCVCFECAKSKGWINSHGDIKTGITL